MAVSQESLVRWEHAEVERSRVQATLTARALPTAAQIFERYANPPANTPYPLEYLYHLVGDIRGLDVLDYGCGDGGDTTLLASRGATIHALDLSPELLGLAEDRLRLDGLHQRVSFVCSSAHAVPLPDESMDLVFGHSVLHHLDLKLAESEVYRVLKPGGRALFFEPVRNSKLARRIRPWIPYRQPDVSPFERPLLEEEIQHFSRQFRMARRREFMLPFIAIGHIVRLPFSVQHRLYEWDRYLLAAYPALRHYATVTVFELFKKD